jgi:hypothetical protein
MTPGGHATELRLVGDLQSSPTGGVHCGVDAGAKSAGEGWASEQEGAAAGIRARENRCEKSLRAAARGKRCMSPCPALVAMRERERETNRQRSWLCSTAPSVSTVTSPSRRGGGNGLQLVSRDKCLGQARTLARPRSPAPLPSSGRRQAPVKR